MSDLYNNLLAMARAIQKVQGELDYVARTGRYAGTFDLGGHTLTIGGDTTISGGGTIGLGGATLSLPVSVANGGTGATTAASARANLDAAQTAHFHTAGGTISGVFDTARLGSGTANATTLLFGDSTWAALAATDIPNLDTSKLTTGTIGAARLGSGTASAATVLHGNSTWSGVDASNEISAGTLPGIRGGTGVSNSGKTLTISTSGTAVVGTGTSGQVAYWSGTNTIASNAGMTYNAGTNSLTVTGTVDAGALVVNGPSWTLLGGYSAGTFAQTGYVTINIGGTPRRFMVG